MSGYCEQCGDAICSCFDSKPEQITKLTAKIDELEQQNTLLRGVFSREEELKAHIEAMQKREAMLINVLKYVKRDCITSSDSFLTQGSLNRIDTALSATSAETETWLQTEILKRLGEPIGIVRMSNPPDGNPKPLPKWILSADQSHLKDGDKFYALPSPLTTPKE